MENVTFPDDHLNEELRGHRITTGDTGRMLGAGWLLFLGSQILNLVFYQMHPSSPEMWTWGKAEKIEEWTPLEEKKTQDEKGEWEIVKLRSRSRSQVSSRSGPRSGPKSPRTKDKDLDLG